ncbi:MAG TPA: universal stress protein [Phenylobacterium sp.]
MSYKDILVHIDETPSAALRASAAAELARRFRAQLIGVFLTSDFMQQPGAGEGLAFMPPPDIDAIIKGHADAVAERAEAARMVFERAAGEGRTASNWLTCDGDFDDYLLQCARRVDLTVMGRSAHACLGGNRVSAAQVALGSGGPVLVTPDDDYAAPIGQRVLVAWNGSREAARALRDAWPIIGGAQEFHVLVVSPQGEGGPDSLLQRHFERHGRKVDLIVDPADDESAAEVIERNVAELDIDLVVMGLYGRPRLQELVLGGVSRRILDRLPVPVFVSH